MKSSQHKQAAEPGSSAWSEKEVNEHQSGVQGNERLTALTGIGLLVLILVQLGTTMRLGTLLPIHIFVGVTLTGLLLLKLGSTGYRFLRYYTHSPAYVRKGPPRLALRIMTPLFVVMTLLVAGSGISMVVLSPAQSGLLHPLHELSVLIWISLLAFHIGAYLWSALRLALADWKKSTNQHQQRLRWARLGTGLMVLLASMSIALALISFASTWIYQGEGDKGPAPAVIIGLIFAALFLLFTRKWWLKM